MTGEIARIGRRFYLVGVLPALVVVGALAALLASGAPSHPPNAALLVERVTTADPQAWLVGATLILLLAMALEPFHLTAVKLLEGYFWPDWGPFRALGRWCVERHKARRRAFNSRSLGYSGPDEPMTPEHIEAARIAKAAGERFSAYPEGNRVMPTTLGNVLRGSEDLAGMQRYRIPVVAAMPRLYPLLPTSLAAAIGDARNELDVAVSFTWAWMTVAVVSVPLLAAQGAWMALALIAFGLSWLSYRAAVVSAARYGKSLSWALDLYRFDLLEKLRMPLPVNREEELAMNALIWDGLRVTSDVLKPEQRQLRYVHPPIAGVRDGGGASSPGVSTAD